MSDPTPTLTDFLLARITEDEAEARERGTHAMIGHLWKHLPESDYNAIQADWLARSRRVLAECAAKRRIVERAAADLAEEWHTGYTCGAENGYLEILELLAQPYADHSDFDASWGGVR